MSLNGIAFDATMERSRTYNSDVPTYPVEKGFKVSDAVLKNPMEITLKAVITEMPLSLAYFKVGTNIFRYSRNVSGILKQLVDLYYAAEPVTLVTNSGTYHSLVIQTLTIPETTEMVNAVEISMTLKQVRITGNYDIELGDTDIDGSDAYVDYEGPSDIDAGTVDTSPPDLVERYHTPTTPSPTNNKNNNKIDVSDCYDANGKLDDAKVIAKIQEDMKNSTFINTFGPQTMYGIAQEKSYGSGYLIYKDGSFMQFDNGYLKKQGGLY